MEWLYSNRLYRNIRRCGDLIHYEAWHTGWFPGKVFEGTASVEDFINFIAKRVG